MPVSRYVVVNEETKTIVGGPYRWDGTSPWTPPEEGAVMLESEALAAGYKRPDPPSPITEASSKEKSNKNA